MQYSYNLSDFTFREKNASKRFYTGYKGTTNQSESYEIIGQSNNYYLREGNIKDYPYFIVKFNNSYYGEIQKKQLSNNNIKSPFYPNLYNNGFLGIGDFKASVNYKPTKHYILFLNMLKRCYYNNQDKYTQHAYKNITVCDRWKNFQLFCEDVQTIPNYQEWFKDPSSYNLDKDLKNNASEYNLKNCLFIEKLDNVRLARIKDNGEFKQSLIEKYLK